MANYSVSVASAPFAGKVVANLSTLDAGLASAVTSITATWKDPQGTTISTLTRTSTDVSGADTYGNTDLLEAGTGTGLFNATLVMDPGHYGPSTLVSHVTLTVTFVRNSITYTAPPFFFQVVPYNLGGSYDVLGIVAAVMRQTGFFKDVIELANDSNSIRSLQSSLVYGIQAAYKNGVPMVQGTDYLWSIYRSNVQVIPAPAANDHFFFTVQVKSDSIVQDVVTRYTQEVIADLQAHFSTTALMQSPTVAELVKNLCIGELKMETTQGTALDSARFRVSQQLMNDTRKQVIRIQRGEATCYDSTGIAIPRVQGALVGAYHHPDGDFINRLGLINRGEQFTGVYLAISPSPIVLAKRNPVAVQSSFNGAM